MLAWRLLHVAFDGGRLARPCRSDATGAPMDQDDRNIVLLTSGGPLANIVANGLAERVGRLTVIEERPEAKSDVVRRRIRLQGLLTALGQVGFGMFQRLFWPNSKRQSAIWKAHGLDPAQPKQLTIHRVPSVNSAECRALLQALRPRVVAVYGTRILKSETLRAVAAPFINYHAGINPKYRGQHPGYWALAEGDADNAGVTIHLVDAGVDTGSVLYQARVTFAPEDTIASYQHLQAAHALPLFARAIEAAKTGRLSPRTVDLPSRQFFPPTLWGYLATGLSRGVW
jgi:folate-dependent phosphoribosylglycinamide formyltransferase PurN